MADIGLFIGPVYLGHAQAGQKVPVTLVDATNYRTLELTIAAPTIEISKAGAAYAAAADGTWAELSDGDYTVRLNATDTDTLGTLMVRVIDSGTTAETKVLCHVGVSPPEQRANYERIRTFSRRL